MQPRFLLPLFQRSQIAEWRLGRSPKAVNLENQTEVQAFAAGAGIRYEDYIIKEDGSEADGTRRFKPEHGEELVAMHGRIGDALLKDSRDSEAVPPTVWFLL